jgi:4-hydroxy-tetrahydrodipicolinate reductase
MDLAISGICGKMGQRILKIAQDTEGIKVIFGLEQEQHPQAGQEVKGVPIVSDSGKIRECDCLIEFTTPQATLEHLYEVVRQKKSFVIGTTGLTQSQQKEIEQASRSIPLVFAPNMSGGVNLLFELIQTAAKILKSYNVNVTEAHHIHKKDSPSGTAKEIVKILTGQGFEIKNEDVAAIREDEIVGDHKVVFDSDTDRIELSHSAKTRDIFAQGSVKAALWLQDKPPGLYSMKEVLGL